VRIGPVMRSAPLVGRAEYGSAKRALGLLNVGDAIDWNGARSTIIRAADRLGHRVTTRQIAPGLFRVWRKA